MSFSEFTENDYEVIAQEYEKLRLSAEELESILTKEMSIIE